MQEKGHIKEFLQRNKSKLPNMLWLEVSNNNKQFIRLSRDSSIEIFGKEINGYALKRSCCTSPIISHTRT